MSSEVARLRAARALARGETQAAAAREAGVDRATVTRWKKEAAFQDLVLKAGEPSEDPKEEAEKGLKDLVPIAMKVLEDALEGKTNVSPQQQTVALNVIKAAKQLEPAGAGAEGPSTLTTLLEAVDAKQAAG